jgi:hypothetical protein
MKFFEVGAKSGAGICTGYRRAKVIYEIMNIGFGKSTGVEALASGRYPLGSERVGGLIHMASLYTTECHTPDSRKKLDSHDALLGEYTKIFFCLTLLHKI